MTIANVIALLSGVALFLFGMSLMGDGLKKVAGNKLELVLYKLSSTPLKGVLLGTAVTTVIQSSSATSVMVVGFVNSGMMLLKQAIGVIMGAIIGTSITGWIICLSAIEGGSGWVSLISTATLTGVIAVVGIILRMFCKKPAQKHLGDILLGFAVLMTGISAMSGAVAPLKESEAFVSVMTRFSNPVLGILVGIVVTAILQSASSSVGLLQTLAVTGAIDFSVAFPIILGMGIGASVPVLLSAIGANTDARRSAWSYLVVSILGAAVCAILYYALNAAVHFSFMNRIMTAASIALVNTIYRAVSVILLFPFVAGLARQLIRLIPEKGGAEQHVVAPLEERFLANPALAIAHARDAVFDMADVTKENILGAMELLRNYSSEGVAAVEARERVIDRYEDKLGDYLIKITASALDDSQARDVSKYLHAIGDLERISDHAVNLSEAAQEIHDKKVSFSAPALRELTCVGDAIAECLALAFAALKDDDLDSAYHVEPLEELVDNLCDELKLHHIERLQKGVCTLANGFVFNDIVTNFERVSDHCSNLAVAAIELDSTGSFDPHAYLDSVKEMKGETFDRFFDEFAAKYSI